MINKGLELYAWVIMSNHVHLIIGTNNQPMENILRDIKRHTSKEIVKAISENPQESRKEWICPFLKRLAGATPIMNIFNFGSKVTTLLNYGATRNGPET